ncbi:hypothetical protein XELAEV_18037849mg [Xenopus laevis]|uniref:Uncharacterized protein n=1 Tax=Xenopus laevis TaxID=8355 RepID=A0A974CE44_XENLA|nr:hypothetical protein XELAEV_18037849mg [Xenopus laevis]
MAERENIENILVGVPDISFLAQAVTFWMERKKTKKKRQNYLILALHRSSSVLSGAVSVVPTIGYRFMVYYFRFFLKAF